MEIGRVCENHGAGGSGAYRPAREGDCHGEGSRKHYGIPICFVGVTVSGPAEVARNAKEFAEKLEAFGTAPSSGDSLEIETAACSSHDPAADLDEVLVTAAKGKGDDLIVMASHAPDLREHFIASNAGAVVSHAV